MKKQLSKIYDHSVRIADKLIGCERISVVKNEDEREVRRIYKLELVRSWIIRLKMFRKELLRIIDEYDQQN